MLQLLTKTRKLAKPISCLFFRHNRENLCREYEFLTAMRLIFMTHLLSRDM